MADDDELVPNDVDCKAFEPNAFRKEKCKTCGKIWREHKGVIDQKYVDQFLGAKRKAAEDKAKVEAEAKAKAVAKKAAQKIQEQAVEDAWLFDSKNSMVVADEASDDEGGGLVMSIPTPAAPKQQAAGNKPLKVTNLIDFTECDVVEEDGGTASASSGHRGISFIASPRLSVASVAMSSRGPGAPRSLTTSNIGDVEFEELTTLRLKNQELTAEIDHLHLMLQQANDEKSIQVAIVMDEVDEKKKKIEEMRQQQKELEQKVASAAPAANAAEITMLQADVKRLREELAASEEKATATSQAFASINAAELESLRADVVRLSAELKSAQEDADAQKQVAEAANADLANARESAATNGDLKPVVTEVPPAKVVKALRELRATAEKQLALIRIRKNGSTSGGAGEEENLVNMMLDTRYPTRTYDEGCDVRVTKLSGETICEVRVDHLKDAVRDLKEAIEGVTGVPVVEQQLTYSGTLLQDDDMLVSFITLVPCVHVILTVRPWEDYEIKSLKDYLLEAVRSKRPQDVEKTLARMPYYDDDKVSLFEHHDDLKKKGAVLYVAAKTRQWDIVQMIMQKLDGIVPQLQDRLETIVMYAMQGHGRALEYTSKQMKNNVSIVKAAVKQSGCALRYSSEEMQNNKKIVRAAVKQCGFALQYASEGMRKNEAIVMAAVTQCGLSLQYASEEMRSNEAIVLAAVDHCDIHTGCPLKYAPEEMKKNERIAMRTMLRQELMMCTPMMRGCECCFVGNP